MALSGFNEPSMLYFINVTLFSLAHLPLFDLLNVVCHVSHQWRDVIYRPEFMPWKKAYYKYKVDSHYLRTLEENNTHECDTTNNFNIGLLFRGSPFKGIVENKASYSAIRSYSKLKGQKGKPSLTNCGTPNSEDEPAAKRPRVDQTAIKQIKNKFEGEVNPQDSEFFYCYLCKVNVRQIMPT